MNTSELLRRIADAPGLSDTERWQRVFRAAIARLAPDAPRPVVQPATEAPRRRYPNNDADYSDEDIAFIRANPDETMGEIARALGRKPGAIYSKALRLGIKLRRR
jgi:hypothetical protein